MNRTNRCITLEEWQKFMRCLLLINKRDALMCVLALKSYKSFINLYDLTLDCIDFKWEKVLIPYRSTNEGERSYLIIEYPSWVFTELKKYIKGTGHLRTDNNYVFLTSGKKPVFRTRLNYCLRKASLDAGLKRITPESIRSIYKNFIKLGITEQEIIDKSFFMYK